MLNFHLTVAPIEFRALSQAPTSSASVFISAILRSKHCFESAESSISAIPTAYEDETGLGDRGDRQAHGKKTHRTLKEQQEYLVSSVPGVGNAVAKNLLRHFGSVERVFSATEEELKEVELVGPKTAERIRELVGGEYKG